MTQTKTADIDVIIAYQRPGYSVNIVAIGQDGTRRNVASRWGIKTRRQALAIAADLAVEARIAG